MTNLWIHRACSAEEVPSLIAEGWQELGVYGAEWAGTPWFGKSCVRIRLEKACRRCGELFVPVRRQVFCSTSCRSKTTWENYLRRHPSRRRDYANEYVRRKMRRGWLSSGRERLCE